MNLREKPQKREQWLFGVAVVVFALFYLKSCVWEQHKEGLAFEREIEAAKMQQQQAHVGTRDRPIGQKMWVGTAAALQTAPERLLEPARLAQVWMNKNQFSPIIQNGSLSKREVSVSVVGNYFELEKYIHYLENLPAPVVITRFTLESSEQEPGLLSLELSGEIYGTN